jgi:hypothetical protein
MTMESFFLICFGVGLSLSVLAIFAGTGHLHLGHTHFGHIHTGKPSGAHGLASAFNGFTLPAFLCWFGGTGYMMYRSGLWSIALILLFAIISGIAGASLVYALLFKILMPRERVLSREDTEMAGVVARVSDQIRPGGTGEILFSQMGARKSAAARSEDGSPIPRDAEVLVLRYERGIAYVRTWDPNHTLEAMFSAPTRTELHD